MAAGFSLELDDQVIAHLTAAGGLVDQAVGRVAGRVRDRAKVIITQEHRVDTGAMRQSIQSERVSGSHGNTVTWRVGSNLRYAAFQHEGVKGPVYPRNARVLRFKPKKGSALARTTKKGSKGYVFFAHTKGFEGIHFLTRAAQEISDEL